VTKIERLEKRLEEIAGGGDVWGPQWLALAGSEADLAEWRAISRSHRGQDLYERRLQFEKAMRLKHPNMPATAEEAEAQGVAKLTANPWLRWREGLHDDPVADKIVAQLSHEEWYHLSKAILAFDKADAAPDAVLTSSLADLPSEQHAVIEKVRRLSRENERGRE